MLRAHLPYSQLSVYNGLPIPREVGHRRSFLLAFSLTHASCSSVSSSSRCLSPSRGWCPPAAWKNCTGQCCPGWTSTAPCPSSGQVSRAAARAGRTEGWHPSASAGTRRALCCKQPHGQGRARGQCYAGGTEPDHPVPLVASCHPCVPVWQVQLMLIEHFLLARPHLRCFQMFSGLVLTVTKLRL